MKNTGPRHNEALRPDYQLMLKKNICDEFFHFYIRAIINLKKDLKNDDKTCDVFSSYYVSTTTI